jgi:hypothetical protein
MPHSSGQVGGTSRNIKDKEDRIDTARNTHNESEFGTFFVLAINKWHSLNVNGHELI